MVTLQRILNVLFILVLSAVLLASYYYQYTKHEDPCPLCLLQRLGMTGIAIALVMNLRFGIKAQHYALAILSALLGRIVSLRQISLHVCPEFPTFGEPILGFDLYVWAFIVFSCSIFASAILLMIHGFSQHREHPPTWGLLEKFTARFVGLITLANVVTTFMECGFTDCA